MPLEIVRHDITRMRVDAVVNAANEELAQGGGVCGAIFAAAGAESLAGECRRIGRCGVGEAVITGGYALPARHIIHTVGPVWRGGGHMEEKQLASCYASALRLAMDRGCASVAFPLISSGNFGYPRDQALQTAIAAIGAFLLEHDMTVYLVVFDKASYALGDRLFHSIKAYIDDNYADAQHFAGLRRRPAAFDKPPAHGAAITYAQAPMAVPQNLDDAVARMDETFSEALLRLIDEKGRKDSEIYKRANVDRKLFSKIRSNSQYRPGKATAIAFAVALELNLDETGDLLRKAGFALSRSSKFDLIVEYFIREGNHNIFEINEALFAFGQSLLGAQAEL